MEKSKKGLTKDEIHAIIDPYKWIIIQAIVFFVAAGHLNLPRAWLYFSMILIASILGTLIIFKLNHELFKHRTDIPPDTENWDKLFLGIYFLLNLIIIPIIAGLDVGRFHWSSLNIHFMIIGIVCLFIGYILLYWAMIVNRHFEGTARIQKDRDHQVITNGPYKIMRHPGYLAMILLNISVPLILGSVIAFIPVGIAIIAVIIRTSLEDKMLQNELNGYSEYAKKVKYRLLPGIW